MTVARVADHAPATCLTQMNSPAASAITASTEGKRATTMLSPKTLKNAACNTVKLIARVYAPSAMTGAPVSSQPRAASSV